MSEKFWIIGDRLGYCWDAWKEIRGSFLLGLFALAIAFHFAVLAGLIAWLEFQ